MSVALGRRIIRNVDRPPMELLNSFHGISSSQAGDAMNRLYSMDGSIRAMLPASRLLGTAFTVNAPAGDNLLFRMALDLASEGDVIVVNGEGCVSRSICGEMLFRYAASKGIAGLVICGSIRDSESLENIGLPVFASGITAKGALRNGPGEINVPVACGGVVV